MHDALLTSMDVYSHGDEPPWWVCTPPVIPKWGVYIGVWPWIDMKHMVPHDINNDPQPHHGHLLLYT